MLKHKLAVADLAALLTCYYHYYSIQIPFITEGDYFLETRMIAFICKVSVSYQFRIISYHPQNTIFLICNTMVSS